MDWNLTSYSSTQDNALNDPLRQAIRQAYRQDESSCLAQRLEQARRPAELEDEIHRDALALVKLARQKTASQTGIGAFLGEYDLSSSEGVLLMCLAEALLRVPDTGTADRLIRDHLSIGHWDDHLGSSTSVLVNASTWGLLFSGRLLQDVAEAPESGLKKLVGRLGTPLVRRAFHQAMSLLANQFVMGRDTGEALQRARTGNPDLRYSFDCLGEAARCAEDAERYLNAYQQAIEVAGSFANSGASIFAQPGISLKLSALHPRYEYAQRERVLTEVIPRVQELAEQAAESGICLTLDAEEADRLELSLDIFQAVFTDARTGSWQGFGLAVQSYQKRSWPLLVWLESLARQSGKRIPVRLVKGAYWDSEIKRAQELGLDGYPVFTRKAATDVSYLACAGFMLAHADEFYPQFASHNAYTLAWVKACGKGMDFELQRLHGMGEALYDSLSHRSGEQSPVRVYAPVGNHDELLPYLVRRLLENGANSSFLNQLGDEHIELDQLVRNPCRLVEKAGCKPHTKIPLPVELYGEKRRNSSGRDLSDPLELKLLENDLKHSGGKLWDAAPCIPGYEADSRSRQLTNPAARDEIIGQVSEVDSRAVELALQVSVEAALDWDLSGGASRAQHLYRAADLFELESTSLVARIVREGGRTLADALDEVREAVDFCRYYALQAEQDFTGPLILPGPAGERNELQLRGRGVFACISPWNFPLAIFVGQIAAALASGNCVLAKPARQTPLTACHAVQLMHRAGIPDEVLHFLPGSGAAIGPQLFADDRLGGVVFTGSTDTAWHIQRSLAQRGGPIIPLIAETGGQNVLLADSSALPEQLVSDVLRSAFNSAGQRCSALRVLFVQEEIFRRVIQLLCGAMEELTIGDPRSLACDVGPLIDRQATDELKLHVNRMNEQASLLHRVTPPVRHNGDYSPLYAFELPALSLLDKEVFGPVLHLVRYQGDCIDKVIDAINNTGYGLTLGVHSRIQSTWTRVSERARVGNLYINRNMIGAVVGSQPFGGEGLSGTGPKAGGPYYLHRFAVERTRCINTTAMGGNASLYLLSDD